MIQGSASLCPRAIQGAPEPTKGADSLIALKGCAKWRELATEGLSNRNALPLGDES
jgi:hypothetical protein